MKRLVKLEDAAKFVLAYYATIYLDYSWWIFFVWLFVPDLSMIGYLVNPNLGASVYNFFHHQGVAIGVFIIGMALYHPELQLVGIILFGHSALDRVFGYGLKYSGSFSHTHLGIIGRKK